MKILLIQPPNMNMLTTNVPAFVDQETGFYPPLGLFYLAAYLQKNSSHTISVLDAVVERVDYQILEQYIAQYDPDVVGIQMMSFTVRDTLLTARAVKRAKKQAQVVVGGPHPNIYAEETIAQPDIDMIVLGEGEHIFTELIQYLEKGMDLHELPGIVFKNKGQPVRNPGAGFIADLDSLPFPARELTPYRKYYSVLSKRAVFTTMISSRGCPYRCLFCDRAFYGKIHRMRSAENVVSEMERCQKMGIEEIDFQDDIFTFSRKRVFEICDRIQSKKLNLSWNIRSRVDTIDKEMLKRMSEAGCQRIYYGIESGTPELQKVLRKNIDLEKAIQVFRWTRDCNISTLAYFMIGSPSETKRDIYRTIEYMNRLHPDFVHISITTPFPGTDLYSLGLKNGLFEKDYWQEYARNPFHDFTPRYWNELLTRQELLDLLRIAYKKFYLRPQYIICELMKIRSLKELMKKIKMGIRMILFSVSTWLRPSAKAGS